MSTQDIPEHDTGVALEEFHAAHHDGYGNAWLCECHTGWLADAKINPSADSIGDFNESRLICASGLKDSGIFHKQD